MVFVDDHDDTSKDHKRAVDDGARDEKPTPALACHIERGDRYTVGQGLENWNEGSDETSSVVEDDRLGYSLRVDVVGSRSCSTVGRDCVCICKSSAYAD